MDPARSILKEAKKLLGCDHARIWWGRWGRERFLIIGTNRSTKDDPGQWMDQDGNPKYWTYIQEATVASGTTWSDLRRSLRHYAQLTKTKWGDTPEQVFRTLQRLTAHGLHR